MALRKEAPTFKMRCSALGQLMTPGRSKSDTLSETAKSMLTLWYKEQLYKRRKQVDSKYLTKGNDCEEASIAYLNSLYDTSYTKNEQHYENDYLMGTPDIIADRVIDIKNSWDFTTFPLFSKDIPAKEYAWQVQGYMILTGIKQASVIYTLMDLPDEQIEAEWRRSGNTGLMTPQFKAQYKYGTLPSDLRVKRFDFEYNADLEAQIIEKVEHARRFISALTY